MRQLNKRKITIILIVALMLLVEIIILGFSRANNIKEIQTTITDYGKLVEDDNLILNAINSGKGSYYVVLPEMVNNKIVTGYYVAQRQNEQTDTEKEETAEQTSEVSPIEENTQTATPNEENTIIEGNTDEETNNTTRQSAIDEKKPGEKLYLTATEIEEKRLNLTVKYDEKEKNGQKLYNKHLEQIIDDKNITVEGYMPENAILLVANVNEEQTKDALKDVLNKDITYKVAYDIKLLSNEKEYNPTDFDENVKVSISGVDTIDKENQKYKVVHIDNENKVEEIDKIELKDNEVVFDASSFSTYAILLDNTMNLENLATYASVEAQLLSGKDVWDGSTVATKFKYGSGTATAPYLIRNCEELALLRNNVNAGTTYEGTYFQLVNDLDLNGKEWTPIGSTANPFQGVFDGAGYIIANANITISRMPSSGIDSYGFFGSIGGGNAKAIVKNVQFSKIAINITATQDGGGTTLRGYHIGTVAGTLYKNAVITNNMIKSCTISDKNSMKVQNNLCRVAIGGIAGFVANKYDSSTKAPLNETDPGAGSRYEISKCFTDVEISSTIYGAEVKNIGQLATAGIVGIISAQPVWPDTCLYVGKITSNGFAGPIFGYLKNSTSYTTTTNYSTLWNGNDAEGLSMTSYYNSYSVNGTSFISSETDGNSSSAISTDKTKIQSVQGVNKGIYIKNIEDLTGGTTEVDKGIRWKYENGTYVLTKRYNNEIVDDTNAPTYKVSVDNTNTPIAYTWYVNDILQKGVTGNSITQNASWDEGYNIDVIIKDSGNYYDVVNLEIPKITLDISFNKNTTNNTVTASLKGTGLEVVNLSDYTYQWYTKDVSGMTEEIIDGANSTTLTNLQKGVEYKLVVTNNKNENLSRGGSFVYETRNVVYVKYSGGLDTNNGLTPETAVKTMQTAYSKIDSKGEVNTNVIVVIGNYTAATFTSSLQNTTNKPATITGAYAGKDYLGSLIMAGASAGRCITADTNFENITFYGSTNDSVAGTANLYLQGQSLTMGNNIKMARYAMTEALPNFNIYAGWLRQNEIWSASKIYSSNIEIKSGQYYKIILGNGMGTNAVGNLENTNSHNIVGSSSNKFIAALDVDYTENLKQYDIGIIAGGSEIGTIYATPIINIKQGTIKTVIGGNYADSSNRPTSWAYPLNTFIGTSTINITGGQVDNIIGASLGRNVNGTIIKSDAYFYGTTNINISGGIISNNIYGAGLGSTTGYHSNSSDSYKSYGAGTTTTTNIKVSGGTINGNIYGGGYAYSEYLTEAQNQKDSGTLYGNSNITISGTPTINGDIYGAGRGYNYSSLANNSNMIGNSTVTISGTPTIGAGKVIYGAGDGTALNTTAGLSGNTIVNVNATINKIIYGGGNSADVSGNTTVNLNSSNSSAIYGGSNNTGKVTVKANININSGTYTNIYGGGKNTVNETNIIGTGGQATNIYGGGTGTTNITNVNIKGTKITGTVYGAGGANSSTKTTNVTLTSSSATIQKVYGGGSSSTSSVTTTNVNCNGATVTTVYGGSNQGNVNQTNIKINSGAVTNVYGGNYTGGAVTKTNITGAGGQANNIYGGGIRTITGGTTSTDTTNITIKGTKITGAVYGAGGTNSSTKTTNVTLTSSSATIPNVYGGGSSSTSSVTTTNINCDGATATNVYGGSNQGNVNKTNIKINSGTVTKVYGGNNNSGEVEESTNIIIQGGTISDSIYGGGNGSSTKLGATEKNATSNVNIVKGTINGKIYGGGYNSVVYGDTNIKIGKDAVSDPNLTSGNININGYIYGGAKATTTSHTGVSGNANVNINANGHTSFTISNSIFGDGEASAVSGTKNVNIKNYGTSSALKTLTSIEKATVTIIDNSVIHLTGATNTENKYSSVKFALNKIDHLKLANNSRIYLDNGANLLKEYSSILLSNDGNTEELETVKIENSGGSANQNTVTTNVDNRIYILQGSNLNIATNEDVTQYGIINGMAYLGLYTSSTNPIGTTTLTGTDNVYVLGKHKANHNIQVDGFYTNKSATAYKYIDVTPKNTGYYIWVEGYIPKGETYETEVTAIKYTTTGTVELPLTELNTPNAILNISKIDSILVKGVSIKDKSSIPSMASTETIANTTFGLEMKTGITAWTTNATTKFTVATNATVGSYSGDSEYFKDNSTQVPSLIFSIYNSQNISKTADLGFINVNIQTLKSESALRYNISEMIITVNIKTSIEQLNGYTAGITPGEKFNTRFETIETNITDSSEFSTYYELEIPDFSNYKYYADYADSYKTLVSTDSSGRAFPYPTGTKITMLDMVTNKYYYYIVSEATTAKNSYNLADFLEMGTTNKHYNETEAKAAYFNTAQDLVTEKFVFHIDFKEGNITQTKENNALYLELKNSESQTVISVMGSQRENCKYGVFVNKDALLSTTIQEVPATLNLGENFNMKVASTFTQQVINGKTIYDTQYLDKKMGITINIWSKENSTFMNGQELMGVTYEINGTTYYPNVNGTARIKIAENVSNVLSNITVHTENNKSLSTGDYTIIVDTLASADGEYYDRDIRYHDKKEIKIKNNAFGLKLTVKEEDRVINKEKTSITVNMEKSVDNIENPLFTVKMYRRDYSEENSTTYNETIDITTSAATPMFTINLPTNMKTGTYKVVVELYDGESYIGEAYDYFIVK